MITWIDIETTGLDPHSDQILEVACIITDDAANRVRSWTWLNPSAKFDQGKVPAVVWSMHEKSGLWSDLEYMRRKIEKEDGGSPLLPHEWDWSQLTDFIYTAGAEKSPMAGNSVHFDRSFLVAHYGRGRVDNAFSHRIIDVSSIKEMMRREAPWVHDEWKSICDAEGEKVHRAMPDLMMSIKEYKFYVSAMRYGAMTPLKHGPVVH